MYLTVYFLFHRLKIWYINLIIVQKNNSNYSTVKLIVY